jgi:1-acyl-sn-glycerol-3-phosphate acyltransferase
MKRLLKIGFVAIAKVIVYLLLGLQVYHREHLPRAGPAILVANHNSHLDTFVLMALFPLAMANRIRPVASEQYFLRQNPWLAWFSRQVLDIVPVECAPLPTPDQKPRHDHRTFLTRCDQVLQHNQILILFPEGSRGHPDCLNEFQTGIAHLAKRHPQVPVVPIFLNGLGKALPKDDPLLVPFVCGVHIGRSLFWTGKKQDFMQRLSSRIQALAGNACFAPSPAIH